MRNQIEALFAGDCRIYTDCLERGALLRELDRYWSGHATPLVRLIWRLINLEKWMRLYG